MRSVPNLIKLIKPLNSTRSISYAKQLLQRSDKQTPHDVSITLLQSQNYDDFESFRKIITNENIVFTSSWIDKWFGIKKLKMRCEFMSRKLEMLEAGDPEITLPEDALEAHKKGVSATQIALNRFFTVEENKDRLRQIYLEMTSRANETGLGYYKFEDNKKDLLGGGALAPISEDAKKVDVALHILKSRRGIGSHCLEMLLDIAFNEKGVEEVWGSSIVDHPGTPTLCAKHGMIIQNVTDSQGAQMKYYFIDRKMREASKGKAEDIVRKNPIAASTHYNNSGKSNSSR